MKAFGSLQYLIGKEVWLVTEADNAPVLVHAPIYSLSLTVADADAALVTLDREKLPSGISPIKVVDLSLESVFESSYDAIRDYENRLDQKTREVIDRLQESAEAMKPKRETTLAE